MGGFNIECPEIKQRYLGSLDSVLNDINIEKVLNKLQQLQVNKAADVDGIVQELLVGKNIRVSLSVPLSVIFNHSFKYWHSSR